MRKMLPFPIEKWVLILILLLIMNKPTINMWFVSIIVFIIIFKLPF